MKDCMTSLAPSTMRLMRESRKIRSISFSVMYPSPPMICIASLTHPPAHFGAEELADGGFEHDVFIVPIEHTGGHVEDRIHRIGEADMWAIFACTSSNRPTAR